MAGKFSALTLLLGERLDLARIDAINRFSTSPLAFRVGDVGYAVLFRYGVIVLCGLTQEEEERVLAKISPQVVSPLAQPDEDREAVEVAAHGIDQMAPGGPIYLKELSPDRVLVVADALAKSAALHRYEREVEAVLDVIEPLAHQLAQGGRTKAGRRTIIRHIGQALLVRHRVTGIAAIDDKPEILWDRPDLERFYLRLEDEYELGARAGVLREKLAVIGETATALTDLIDTARSYRLEIAILILVGLEVVIGLFEIVRGTT